MWRRRRARRKVSGRALSDGQRHREPEFLEPRQLLAGDLMAHWRADDLVPLGNGAVVEQWADQVSQISAERDDGAPQLVTDRLGGRAMVRFEAADGGDRLTVPAAVSPMANATDFSVLVAFVTSSANLIGGEGDWFQNTGLVDANRFGWTADWGISLNANGQVGAGLGKGIGQSPSNLYSSGESLNDGQLHVVALSRQQASLTLYVDGAVSGTRNDVGESPRAKLGIALGSMLSGDGFYTGEIGEVRVYDGPLTPSEVTQITSEIITFYSNRPPISVPDHFSLEEDQILLIPRSAGVLANDTDADEDPLSAILVTDPLHGELTLQPDGSFAYVPEPNFHGTDEFLYKAFDFRSGQEAATVTLEVRPVHDPVQPAADQYQGLPTDVLLITAQDGLLANDRNVDGSPLTVILDQDSTPGKLTVREDGAFEYDPQGNAGAATFRYRVDDGTVVSESVEVTLLINTPPSAVADAYTMVEDSVLSPTAASGILVNDRDAEDDPLTVQLELAPAHGALTLQADGSFRYEPEANFVGADLFRYRLSDGIDDSEVVAVTIDVTPVNDPPIANPDGYSGLPDRPISTGPADGVLANDTDVDHLQLQAILHSLPEHGQLTLESDGSFVYQPDPGFLGTDEFRYRASDLQSESADTVVLLEITDQPVVISEFMASNSQTVQTHLRATHEDNFEGETFSPDWIELHNLLDQSLDLDGMYLTDDARDLQKWAFPAGTHIAPHETLVIFASGQDVKDPMLDELGWLHTNFQLAASPGYLALTAEDGRIVHALAPDYPPQRTDISYGIADLDPSRTGYFLQPTPGGANAEQRAALVADTQFSVDRGFYTEPIEVQITTATPGAVIRYTTDGSPPSETRGLVYQGPLSIDRTTTLRAMAFHDGLVPTNIDTHTYFFLQDVLKQTDASTRAAGFPSNWRGTAPDYGLDDPSQFPRIAGDVNMPQEQAERAIQDSLLSIPTLSIVMNVDDMFGTQGIYSNPEGTGEQWERPTSVELVHPDGREGFQIDAGIRIQGGAFRSFGLTKKNSLRLVFKTQYGPATLKYPLFGSDATDEFNTLTLRMESNDGWQWGDAGGQPQYARDEFLRRTQLAMGQPASHGTPVHVYINGFYWGLYNAVERPDQSFGAAYFGADRYDWDGINSGAPINADDDRFRTSRTQKAWRDMVNLARDVQRADTQEDKTAALMKLQGQNPDGTDNPEWENYLDLVNMIDYLIVNYYADNRDWPFKNYYIGRENSPDSTGFKFFTWDAEWSLLLRSSVTGDNISDNRGVAAPFQYLRSSDEFRVLFGDRVQKHFAPGGALYVDPEHPNWDPERPERNVPAARYVEWTGQVYEALLAESARWGDQHRGTPYTRDTDWQREFDRILQTWFPRRSEFLLGRFRAQKLFPTVEVAQFNQRGGSIAGDFGVALAAEQGEIYYTLDGTDPRQIGGTVAPDALRYTEPFFLAESGSVRLRVLDDGSWSALDEASFLVDTVPADRSNLRVSEVHYHPANPSDAERAAGFTDRNEFEFLELVNIGSQTIDLTEVEFREMVTDRGEEGIDFRFADSPLTRLASGERILVVENIEAFELRYGTELPVAGSWSGRLANGGEQITLWAGQELLQQFTYDDHWYESTDGGGWSLEIVDPTADLSNWNLASGWRASQTMGGSPGTDGQLSRIPGDANGDGRFDSADFVAVFTVGEYEDEIHGNSTFAEGDWNGDGDFDSLDIVFAFQSGMYELAVVPALRALQERDQLFEREDTLDDLFCPAKLVDRSDDADGPDLWR